MSSETFSIVDALLEGQAVEVQGDGELRLQPNQDGPPPGPGQVRFAFRYAPEELSPGTPHTHALGVALSASDDEGQEILKARLEEGTVPMGRYDLTGEADVGGQRLPVLVETLYVDPRTPASAREFFGQDHAQILVCGEGEGIDLQRVRALLPNLWTPKVDVEAGGLRIRLESQVDDSVLGDPYHAG
jgi:hypothetical protein